MIGGAERSGKTTILNKIMIRKPMIAIQTDAIRDSLMKALIGDVSTPISRLSLSGDVTFQNSDDDYKKENTTKHFSKEISQSELVWSAIFGLINYYDNESVDLIIEGIDITPERIKSLNLKNFLIKPVFVGFTENTDFNIAIADLGKDGFNITDLDKDTLKKRFDEHVEKGKKIAISTNKHGYKFFSLDNYDFERYCNNVVNYLLE